MKRYTQLLELHNYFIRDFKLSLAGLTTEEQLIITGALKKMALLFQAQGEDCFEKSHAIFEGEILQKLRHKAQVFHQLHVFEYLEPGRSRLTDVLNDLNVKPDSSKGEHELSESEYSAFISNSLVYIMRTHEMLLLIEPQPQEENKELKENVGRSDELSGESELQPRGDREEYMSIADCAKFLDCSKVTIHEYKKQGMPHYQIGRTVKFKKSEVLNFMRQQDRRKRK